ncbi:MAG: DegV family protein [Candidatus Poribacteria bacterium]
MVKIVTDSTCDLTKEMVERYGIEVVPLTVHLGDRAFRDFYDVTSLEFFQMLRDTDDFPTTSQPSVEEFIKTYTKIGDEDDIVSIHISLDMSKTAQSASTAQKQLPGYKINVIDSRTVSVGLGIIVLELAKAAKDGADINEILRLTDELKSKIRVYFSVDSLDYLQKGGRIGKAQGFLGTMLKIKPLLAVADGFVSPVERVRGSSRLISRMVEIVKEDAQRGKNMKCAFIFGENLFSCNELIFHLKSEVQFEELYRNYIGTVITSHAGPTAFGLGYYLS